MPTYKIYEGSIQERFMASRAKIQIYAGGFANGKTSGACIKALQLIRDYPNSNGVLARATLPKLEGTLQKEFLKWCPEDWIKSFNKAKREIVFNDGTTVDLKYIRQQGKSAESSTSNLLSANYDFAVIDQIEDPEIEYKDFLDILGRLRSKSTYVGNDPTMPVNGTRWLIITCNPTRNWVYHKLVKPLHDYQRTGNRTEDLLWDDIGNCPLVELFEGSTYDNADNLEPDYIRTLEAVYQGQMKERFLKGLWGAFEGLIYKDYNSELSSIQPNLMVDYFNSLKRNFYNPTILEAYDFGISVPSCYGLGFVDNFGNLSILDGFHKEGLTVKQQAQMIKDIRDKYNVKITESIYADPSIFKKHNDKGESISMLFEDEGIFMRRGSNGIIAGITKVTSYICPAVYHKSPYTGDYPAPFFYINSELSFFETEISKYRWKRDNNNMPIDEPVDKDDHAMDMIKYILTYLPDIASIITHPIQLNSNVWHEPPDTYPINRRR